MHSVLINLNTNFSNYPLYGVSSQSTDSISFNIYEDDNIPIKSTVRIANMLHKHWKHNIICFNCRTIHEPITVNFTKRNIDALFIAMYRVLFGIYQQMVVASIIMISHLYRWIW